jgi:hypothetical protein
MPALALPYLVAWGQAACRYRHTAETEDIGLGLFKEVGDGVAAVGLPQLVLWVAVDFWVRTNTSYET